MYCSLTSFHPRVFHAGGNGGSPPSPAENLLIPHHLEKSPPSRPRPPPPPTKFPFLFLFFCISCSALQELFNSRLQNLVVTIVPLLPRYCKLEMAGTIFCYHQYFYLTKQCHKSVSLKKNKLS